MSSTVWNSLEVAKLTISVLTPLSVLALGWFVNHRLKRLDHAQWANQKLIEKRLALYDRIAPLLNRLLCFHGWIGNWKDITPAQAIEAKRQLDLEVNIYRHLLDEDFYGEYQRYIALLFVTYNEPGHDARLRALVTGPDGDRARDARYVWDEAWMDSFAPQEAAAGKAAVQAQYLAVMAAFTRAVGIPAELLSRPGANARR